MQIDDTAQHSGEAPDGDGTHHDEAVEMRRPVLDVRLDQLRLRPIRFMLVFHARLHKVVNRNFLAS